MNHAETLVRYFTDYDFISDHWMQQPKVWDLGEYFLKTAQLRSFERTIRKHVKEYPRSLSVYYKGRLLSLIDSLPRDKYSNLNESAFDLIRHIPVVVHLFHLYNPFYGQVSQLLGYKFQARTQSGVFFSGNNAQGAKNHRDRSHIFVFQHQGRCRWRLRDKANENEILNVIMEPGKVLYVPQGVHHQVERLDDFHTHVTLGLRYRTPRAEMKKLHSIPMLRPAIPPEQRNLGMEELPQLFATYSGRPLRPDN